MTDVPATTKAALKAHNDDEERKAREKTEQMAKAAKEEDKKEDQQKPNKEQKESTKERQDPKKEESKQDPKEQPAFKVGTLVKTKSVKFKDQWDGQQAKITGVLKGKFRVQMLTGPEKGKKHDYVPSMLELLVDQGGSEASNSTKTPAPDNRTEAEVASNLFGDPDLCDSELDM